MNPFKIAFMSEESDPIFPDSAGTPYHCSTWKLSISSALRGLGKPTWNSASVTLASRDTNGEKGDIGVAQFEIQTAWYDVIIIYIMQIETNKFPIMVHFQHVTGLPVIPVFDAGL